MTTIETPEFRQAIEALKTYAAGSGRATLLPIDEAVRAAAGQPARQPALEQRLLDALPTAGSRVAREYICRQLVLIGSSACVPAVSALLADAALADAARAVLEVLPGAAASEALRGGLPRLSGTQRIGVIHSIGARRDTTSVPALARLLRDRDAGVATAAAAALGSINSAKAARALRTHLRRAPDPTRTAVADAVLVCVAHLDAEGQAAEAERLCRALREQELPDHIREAAARRGRG